MQNITSKYSTTILRAKLGFLSLVSVLLITATPAYADQSAVENQPINVAPVKVDSKSAVAVDLYGDGMLMLAAPSHGGKKTTKTTSAEVYNYLAPIPARGRSLTVEKIGNTIIIKPAAPAQAAPQLAHRQIQTEPKSVSRVTRSKEVIVMNAIPQE
jgi:hypothetical protein